MKTIFDNQFTSRICLSIAIFIALSICFTSVCFAESAPEEQWNKTFGGKSYDGVYSVQQTSDGGYILAVYTESLGAGAADAWLIKTDSEGNKQWDKTFGGESVDQAGSVQQTSDGGYILAGFTYSFDAGLGDAWLIKTDSKGNKQWDKAFGGTKYDGARSVQQTSDGGYIMAGSTHSSGAGDTDAWLIKTDSEGNKQWDKTFGGTSFDGAYSVQLTSDRGYILAGYTSSFNDLGDAWLIKTDSEGNKQWDKTFGGDSSKEAFSVQQTSDGGYILAGYTVNSSFSSGSAFLDGDWLIKTDSEGNKQWDKTFGGKSGDGARSVQQTSDGGYIMAGVTESFGAGAGDAWLIKTDSEGNKQWDKTFGGKSGDGASSVQQTSDGGYIMAGSTHSSGAGDYDAWLIKLEGNMEDSSSSNNPNTIEKPAERTIPGFGILSGILILLLVVAWRRWK